MEAKVTVTSVAVLATTVYYINHTCTNTSTQKEESRYTVYWRKFLPVLNKQISQVICIYIVYFLAFAT